MPRPRKLKERFVEDDRRNGQGEIDHHDADEVRQQMADDDPRVALPEARAASDELLILERQHLPADDARHGQPFDQAERHDRG